MVKGPGALPGDMPLGDGKLYFASRSRQLLENLSPERGTRGKSAGAKAVEELLVRILHANGEAELNRVRDEARALAEPLGLSEQFGKLDRLIGALLATQATASSRRRRASSSRKARPLIRGRMARFETLAAKLRAAVLARRPRWRRTNRRVLLLRFLEAYFSNYVEGTEFAIEEARDIALRGRIVEQRPKDSTTFSECFASRSVSRSRYGSPFRRGLPGRALKTSRANAGEAARDQSRSVQARAEPGGRNLVRRSFHGARHAH